MAKLSQLLTLECMLDAYDSLNIKDSWIIERQGVCIVELLDIINPKCDLPSFDTPTSFREYLINIGIKKGIPNRSTISKYYDKARGQLPNWTFDDADGTEAIRRNNVGKRFLNLVKRE